MSVHPEEGTQRDHVYAAPPVASETSPVAQERIQAPATRAAALRARRAQARRRTRLARVDLGISVLVALLLLLIAPGLAIAAIVALVALVGCGVSWFVAFRRRRRNERG